MAWKNVQYENGRYRTSSGGGGGSSTFADLEDVDLSNLQDGQVPKYNSSTQKWENANESGGSGHNYSTTEQIVGTWIDGKPLYEIVKTLTLTQNTSAGMQNYPHNISNVSEITMVLCKENRSRPTNGSLEISIGANATNIVAETGQDRHTYVVTVILQYTKTTD